MNFESINIKISLFIGEIGELSFSWIKDLGAGTGTRKGFQSGFVVNAEYSQSSTDARRH